MAVPNYDWIAYHASVQGDRTALHDLSTGRTLTYRAFDRRIGCLATALRDRYGVGRGDRVVVLSHNSSDTFEIQFACARLAATLVPVNWRLAIPELRYILGDAQPTLLIHDPEFEEAALDLVQSCGVRHLLVHETTAHPLDSAYERLLAEHDPLPVIERTTHDDVATILYTSGTTGHPKGAAITFGMRFWQAINLSGPTRISADSVTLTVLPLFHVGGLEVYANPVFHFGGTVLVMRGFDAADCLRVLTDESAGVTLFIGVPAHFLFMSQLPAFATASFHPGLVATVGAAPMPVVQLQQWAERGLVLQQLYGMTETCGGVTALDPGECVRKAGSSGKPLLHMELRLVTPDGREAADNETGEIWVRGPSVTPGYWNNAAANESAFTNGWLRTGDAAVRDSEGFLFIVDRWKDMYISGGENVYPAEVEAVLYQLPGIAEVAIIGVADERWGEVGRAIVAVKPDCVVTEADIMHHCDGNLARYKQPRSVRFVAALPRNATGKVHKPTLRLAFGDGAASNG